MLRTYFDEGRSLNLDQLKKVNKQRVFKQMMAQTIRQKPIIYMPTKKGGAAVSTYQSSIKDTNNANYSQEASQLLNDSFQVTKLSKEPPVIKGEAPSPSRVIKTTLPQLAQKRGGLGKRVSRHVTYSGGPPEC